jgi:hypothetical protein
VRRCPHIPTLIILTLLPCALFALRWYSFHAFDYFLLTRGTAGYGILLSYGTVQLESLHNYRRVVTSPPSDNELISGTLFVGHNFDSAFVATILRRTLRDENFNLEFPTKDWRLLAFGSERYEHHHGGFWAGPLPPPTPPPTIVHYLQFPLWLFIGLATLLALRTWWQFLKSNRRHRAFPVEPASGSHPAPPAPAAITPSA